MIRSTHILLLFVLVLFSSCGRDLSKAFDKLKIECSSSEDPKKQVIPAAKCREWYPIPEKVTEEVIKYLPGKPVIDTEYVPTLIDCDEVIKQHGSGPQIIKVKVPVYTRVDTASVVRSVKIKDMQEIEYWQKKYEAERADKDKLSTTLIQKDGMLNKANASTSSWRIRFFGLIGLVILVVAAYLLKKRYF